MRELRRNPFTRTRLVEYEERHWLEKRFRVPGVPRRLEAHLAGWMATQEEASNRALRGVAGVAVNTRRIATDTLLREWVDGRDLDAVRREGAGVPDGFFDALAQILAEIHRRGCAYNDLERKSNVLLTPTGRPVLIDFQILLRPYRGRWRLLGWLSKVLLRELQQQDVRYLYKMKSRHRPDLLTRDEERAVRQRSWAARLYHPLWRVLHSLKRLVLPKHGRRFESRADRP